MEKKKIESKILEIYKQKIELPSDFIDILQDLELCLQKRISQGSPSKNEVKKAIKTLSEKKENAKMKNQKRIENIKKAEEYRRAIIKKLIA
jgi:hypothetical protein